MEVATYPHDPGVDGAKETAFLGNGVPHGRDVLDQPANLHRTEVRVDGKATQMLYVCVFACTDLYVDCMCISTCTCCEHAWQRTEVYETYPEAILALAPCVELADDICCPAVAPDDSVVERASRRLVPKHRCLPLVGHTHATQTAQVTRLHSPAHLVQTGGHSPIQLFRILFAPSEQGRGRGLRRSG